LLWGYLVMCKFETTKTIGWGENKLEIIVL
jgi:hypothetical protein